MINAEIQETLGVNECGDWHVHDWSWKSLGCSIACMVRRFEHHVYLCPSNGYTLAELSKLGRLKRRGMVSTWVMKSCKGVTSSPLYTFRLLYMLGSFVQIHNIRVEH